jgi:hypothetical protein
MKSRTVITTILEMVFSTMMMKERFCLPYFIGLESLQIKNCDKNGGKWWQKGSKWHLGSIERLTCHGEGME